MDLAGLIVLSGWGWRTGILLSNNFLIAEKTLLTEGPSDVIYLLDAIKRLKAEERLDIDLNDLSIVDGGSSDNYLAMAKLMLSEGRDIVALLDGDGAGVTNESRLKKACPKEYEAKLKITRLASGKSSEDLFADVPTLQEATRLVANFMIDHKIKTLQPGIDLDVEIRKIIPVEGTTLGRVLDDVTSKLFTDGQKLSKLSIALEYEVLSARRELKISKEACQFLVELKRDLGIRGEKTVDINVFEEVK